MKLPTTIDVGKMARRTARKHAAKPPSTRKIADKRRKPPRHRKSLREQE